MGWWSEDVMGGDTPLDLQSFIYNALDIKQYPDKDYEGEIVIPSNVYDYDKIVKHLAKDDEYWLNGNTNNIFHQVLGVMMMESGAPISDELKANIIIGAEKDQWANEDGGDELRKKIMDSLIETIKSYDGTPTKIKSAGLLDKLKNK